MTKTQKECLIAASHGNAEAYHGKTRITLVAKGLIRWVPGQGLMLTAAGRLALIGMGVPEGEIGKREAS